MATTATPDPILQTVIDRLNEIGTPVQQLRISDTLPEHESLRQYNLSQHGAIEIEGSIEVSPDYWWGAWLGRGEDGMWHAGFYNLGNLGYEQPGPDARILYIDVAKWFARYTTQFLKDEREAWAEDDDPVKPLITPCEVCREPFASDPDDVDTTICAECESKGLQPTDPDLAVVVCFFTDADGNEGVADVLGPWTEEEAERHWEAWTTQRPGRRASVMSLSRTYPGSDEVPSPTGQLVLGDRDLGFVLAYAAGKEDYAPEASTRPYTAEELRRAVDEVALELGVSFEAVVRAALRS